MASSTNNVTIGTVVIDDAHNFSSISSSSSSSSSSSLGSTLLFLSLSAASIILLCLLLSHIRRSFHGFFDPSPDSHHPHHHHHHRHHHHPQAHLSSSSSSSTDYRGEGALSAYQTLRPPSAPPMEKGMLPQSNLAMGPQQQMGPNSKQPKSSADGMGADMVASAEEENGAECAVCLNVVEGDGGGGEAISVLPGCNHRFHWNCIGPWFESHNTCPVCRKEIRITINAM